jgi:Na+-translocating ferredoxin:NAD+ oxidoreductase RnfE subunit
LIPALGSAALTACAYLSVLVGFAILREWLGTGTLSLDLMQLRSAASPPVSLPVSQPASQPDMVVPTTPWSMPFMLLPPAACLLLGLLLAVRNWLQPAATDRVTHKGEIIPVARVRVTGRIQGS